MKRILAVDGLSVRAGDNALLRDVSFALAPGEALTLVGQSGAGKSLLAQAIMGNLPDALQAAGTVEVAGVASAAADHHTRRPLWGRQLGLLPQEPWLALDPTMRILAQVEETYRHVRRDGNAANARQRAREALAGLGLQDKAGHYPHQISGGMAQRVAFAAVYAGGAPILIADEPTKGLDRRMRDEVVTLLREALLEGCALLTVTHDLEVAEALGGRLAVIEQGRIVESGATATVMQVPQHPYTQALLAAQPRNWPAEPAPASGQPLLTAQGLAKAFGAQRLFAGIDLCVHAGERLALTGPSGCGKTTLGNILLGVLKPDAGRVVSHAARPFAFQKLYQDPVAAFPARQTLRQTFADLCRLHRLDPGAAEPLLAELGLDAALLDRLPSEVSGGELQRIAIARILLLQPQLVFADEPTSRLDAITQKQTMAVLLRALERSGAALVLVTHDDALAERVAGRRLAIDIAN
ncbi:ABC transporter ATP-binding protein [Azonexus hydrophilus]|uniref:ABC transporter ATP-binding protein n=1 Tax=Azonexus hydrophilus TaxID=418702 RepID=UPI0003FF7404|nr:ATP-binding cassette domain-containing protein [Azonexus hydrophilus]